MIYWGGYMKESEQDFKHNSTADMRDFRKGEKNGTVNKR